MNDTNPTRPTRQRGVETAMRAAVHRGLALAEQLADPDSPLVRDAKSRRCDQCHAKPGHPCTTRGGFQDDLKGRTIHLGRLEKP